MSSKAGINRKECNCKVKYTPLLSNGGGWEGSAVLHHGSHIKMGCLQFVFSITSCGRLSSSPVIKTEKCENKPKIKSDSCE
jgi:PHD finger protein 12